jgi:Ca2+-binding EF-hand superfamily protein
MYDRNHDSKIDRDELLEVLKLMVSLIFKIFDKTLYQLKVGGNIQDEQIATIADHTIGELVKGFFPNAIKIFSFFCLFLGC